MLWHYCELILNNTNSRHSNRHLISAQALVSHSQTTIFSYIFFPPEYIRKNSGLATWDYPGTISTFYHVIIKIIFGGACIGNLFRVPLAVVNLVSLLLPYGYMYIKVYICVYIPVYKDYSTSYMSWVMW